MIALAGLALFAGMVCGLNLRWLGRRLAARLDGASAPASLR
jgi:hypothetical protein